MGDFHGYATHTISNQFLELECLVSAGPRIVRLSYQGSANLLAEVPTIRIPTPFGDYYYIGGHRLWHAPEAMPRTYVPDNDGCTLTPLPDGALLEGKREEGSGVRKLIAIHIEPDRPRVHLLHTLVNEGAWDIKLAPWVITMFRLGGTVTLPTRVENPSNEELLPDRQLTLWPYAHINDTRLKLQDDYIQIYAQPGEPFKIGMFNSRGWITYQIDGIVFKKSFAIQTGQEHVDTGCNAECYCDHDFVELESLGALSLVPVHGKVQWAETWELSQAN